MRGKVYIDGRIVDPAAATISVFDRGFLYGDSVFETLRVYGGKPFALEEHLERLFASGERVGFTLPWSSATLRAALAQTLAASGLVDAYVRIIATRGTGTLGLDPALAEHPTLIFLVVELPALPASLYEQGRTAWLVSASRHGTSVDPQAKTGNYLNSVLATREATAHGAQEAIMLDGAGRVAEASSANLFALVDGVWCTPPLDVGILSGITRKTLLRLCEQAGVPAEERVLWPVDLQRATEIFLCASVREIVPIVRLNDAPVGDGAVGAGTRELRVLYRQEVTSRTA
jgi:branched-chain amino acid aminotransferase